MHLRLRCNAYTSHENRTRYRQIGIHANRQSVVVIEDPSSNSSRDTTSPLPRLFDVHRANDAE